MNKFFIGAAALLMTAALSAQNNFAITDYSFEDETFTISNMSDSDLTQFAISISEEVSEGALVLDDEMNPNAISTVAYSGGALPPGMSMTLPAPVAWGRWMKHGMFSHVDNVALISIWQINGGVPWLYADDLATQYGDGQFGDNFFLATGVVTENLIEIAPEQEFVYICGDTGVETARLVLPQVSVMNDNIEFYYEGFIEAFSFTLYNAAGQVVAYTTDIDSYPFIDSSVGVYVYTMTCIVDGVEHTTSDNFYISN